MLKCKSATLTPEGGINTVWEDSKDSTREYEICLSPETAEVFIDYEENWRKENENNIYIK